MCLYPELRRNKKYQPNKKNGGVMPSFVGLDTRVLWVPTACGKCMECMKMNTREWQARLSEDIKTNKNGHFVTLTFSTESLKELLQLERLKDLKGYERDNQLCTVAMRLYNERYRKKHKVALRHWMITELGKGKWEHVHMHGIIWTDHIEDITAKWQYGHVVVREYVNEKTINYITKYMKKIDLHHKEYKPKMLTSAGIGSNYVNTYNARTNKYEEGKTDETYITRTGVKVNMPKYWRNKIYTEEEKEKLWIEKLDKNERWVDGIKIENADKNEIEYREALRIAQLKNKRLGYGNNNKNWKIEQYENERRDKLYKERLSNTESPKGL